MDVRLFTLEEIERRIAGIEFKLFHTTACQEKNGYNRWTLPDKRKSCTGCKVAACGVIFDRFDRIATGETTETRAKEVVRGWYRQANAALKPDPKTQVAISTAIEDYLLFVGEEAKPSTIEKYESLMAQLEAFCEWKNIRFVQQLDQDYILEFSRALGNEDAGYKLSNLNEKGQRRWTKMSVDTVKRSARTLKGFFARCIDRKWIKENHANILKTRRRGQNRQKKSDVKYLTRQQMEDILWAVDQFASMTVRNPRAGDQRSEVMAITNSK
jgi:integrase